MTTGGGPTDGGGDRAFAPGSVDELIEYVETTECDVFVLRWVADDRSRTEFVVDVGHVPGRTRGDGAAVDVRSVDADPSSTRPVPVAAIESVVPTEDAETVTNALPVDPSARVDVLGGLADWAPHLVDVSPLLAVLDPRAGVDPDTVSAALVGLATVAQDRPDDCVSAVPNLRTLVSETDGTADGYRVEALTCLAIIAAARPGEVVPHVAAVFPLLDSPERPAVRAAVACVAHVAHEDPDAVVDCTDELVRLLDATDTAVRRHAAFAVGRVAVAAPEAVRPAVARLAVVAGDRTAPTETRLNVTCAVGRLAGTSPDAVVDHLPTFVDALGASEPAIRANAAGVVGDIAARHAVDARRHVEPLVSRLDDVDDVTRANASTAVARVAREFPDAVVDHLDSLIGSLDDTEPLVRENACWTLGYLRDEARPARRALERVHVDDANGRVRDRARWALGEVEDGRDGVGASD